MPRLNELKFHIEFMERKPNIYPRTLRAKRKEARMLLRELHAGQAARQEPLTAWEDITPVKPLYMFDPIKEKDNAQNQ